MEGPNDSLKKQRPIPELSLMGEVFSWSIHDLQNQFLYKDKVKQIPAQFHSTSQYFDSFIHPLIEETRAELASAIAAVPRTPATEVLSVEEAKGFKPPSELFYKILLDKKKAGDAETNGSNEFGVGDLFAVTEVRPKFIDDLNRPGKPFMVALVIGAKKDDPSMLTIQSSKPLDFKQVERKAEANSNSPGKLFLIFLSNMTTNLRIWRALIGGGNSNIIKKVLPTDLDDTCNHTSPSENCRHVQHARSVIHPFNLNVSQEAAILSCIPANKRTSNNHSTLIWGPPGTGKTKTVASLLFVLLSMKRRTLICAPTNIAIIEVASRLVKLLNDSIGYDIYGLGDVVLFGNEKRTKIADHDELIDVFLDYRADMLSKCFAPLSGWRHCLLSMTDLLEDPVGSYCSYLRNLKQNEVQMENEKKEEGGKKCKDEKKNGGEKGKDEAVVSKQKKKNGGEKGKDEAVVSKQKKKNGGKKGKDEAVVSKQKKKNGGKKGKDRIDDKCIEELTFKEFAWKTFKSRADQLKFCMEVSYTHLPTCFIPSTVAREMMRAQSLLDSTARLLKGFKSPDTGLELYTASSELRNVMNECLHVLKSLSSSFTLPKIFNGPAPQGSIKNFCLQHSCLIFCTASSSVRLQMLKKAPVEFLVIDEAAQLKECESIIPLQVAGLHYAVLIGDEQQLPPMVQSKISEEAGFGRSLFQRLVLLGHKRHLLDTQYRMHPSISIFPKWEFYDGQILDAPNVKENSYEKHFLPGKMYGTFSFINIEYGNEEFGNGHSCRNLVEVAIVVDLVERLVKESVVKKQKVSVGVISPYNAQVSALKEKLGKKFTEGVDSGFSLSVRSVDGYQGGEDDVIIISTVRCNRSGSIGFLSNRQRANVALTRARHCLWVLGSGATLMRSRSVWRKLVRDSKGQDNFYDANDDWSLARATTIALLGLNKLTDLLHLGLKLFMNTRWKVFFSDEFWRSMVAIHNAETQYNVLLLLEKLSTGWRQPCKERNPSYLTGASSQMLNAYDVAGPYKLVWTVDLIQENSVRLQVLKIWDVVHFTKLLMISRLVDNTLGQYSTQNIVYCTAKHTEGCSRDLEFPVRWNEYSEEKHSISSQLASLRLSDEPNSLSMAYRKQRKSKVLGN